MRASHHRFATTALPNRRITLDRNPAVPGIPANERMRIVSINAIAGERFPRPARSS